MYRTLLLFSTVALTLLCTTAASAQRLSVSLRGGGSLPVGTFAQAFAQDDTTRAADPQQAFLSGAKHGFGYGLDASISLGSIGLYAGFDQVAFACQDEQCTQEGSYRMGGVSAGIKLNLPSQRGLSPWVKGGLTFSELRGEYRSGQRLSELTTDHTPGYEVAAGLDVPVLGMFAFSPQVRYTGQNFRYEIPGVNAPEPTQKSIGYLKLDLGFSLRSPGPAGLPVGR